MRRLLLIDDDERLGPPLAAFFQRHGLQMQQATRPGAALELLAGGGFDAVILDIMLPEMDGFEVCRRIRHAGPTASLPVIMLTARGEVMDRVVGLELGADDYVAKPFSPRELVARVRSVLRRTSRPSAAMPLQTQAPAAPPVAIDEGRRQIRFYGKALELSRYEFGLLQTLASHSITVAELKVVFRLLHSHQGCKPAHWTAVRNLIHRLVRRLTQYIPLLIESKFRGRIKCGD